MIERARWATVHAVRFREPVSDDQIELTEGPKSALGWVFGPDGSYGPHAEGESFGESTSTVWGGIGLYREPDDAQDAFDDPSAFIPCLGSAVEAWHLELSPFDHRGDVNWLGTDQIGEVFDPVDDPSGSGRLVVVTSAGYVIDENIDLDRVLDFATNVNRVRSWMDGADGLLVQHAFSSPDIYQDAMTFRVWRDSTGMRDFGYREGVHRTQMDRYRSEHTADRTSFTRFRPLRTCGTWGGADPLAAA